MLGGQDMFQIHNDYTDNENPYPSKKLKRQVYGDQRARAKRKTLENITNVVNKTSRTKISKRKRQSKGRNSNVKTSTISKKSVIKERIAPMHSYTVGYDKINPIVEYANTTNSLAHQWHNEIRNILMNTAPTKQLVQYAHVYEPTVKRKYLKVIQSNLLDFYPQWKHIFDHQKCTLDNVTSIENARGVKNLGFGKKNSINYVEVYDLRCKKRYFEHVKMRMFSKFPNWRFVFKNLDPSYIRKERFAVQAYKKTYNHFWNIDEDGTNHIISSPEEAGKTLHTGKDEELHNSMNKIENKLEQCSENSKSTLFHLCKFLLYATTSYLILLQVFTSQKSVVNTLQTSWNQKNVMSKYSNPSLLNKWANDFIRNFKKSVVDKSNSIGSLEKPNTNIVSDVKLIEKKIVPTMRFGENKELLPIPLTPYPSSSTFYFKYDIVIEGFSHKKKNYRIANNIIRRKKNNNDTMFNIQIIANGGGNGNLLVAKSGKSTKHGKHTLKHAKKIMHGKKIGKIKVSERAGSKNSMKMPSLPRERRQFIQSNQKVSLSFSSNVAQDYFAEVGALFAFQVYTKGYIEMHTKICVFVEAAHGTSEFFRQCKAVLRRTSEIQQTLHVSTFELTFDTVGKYTFKALLLHPRHGKLSKVTINDFGVIDGKVITKKK